MTYLSGREVRATAFFLFAFIIILISTQSARAQGIIYGETVAANEIVERDILLNGDDIVLDGIVDGDVLAVGKNVTINGAVNGSLVALAENVIINGEVEGSAYVAALTLELKSTGSVGRSLYFLGASLTTERDSQVGRDLVAISLGARLAGDVGRNTNALVGLLELVKLILDRINDTTTGQPISWLQPNIVTGVRDADGTEFVVVPASFGPGITGRTIQARTNADVPSQVVTRDQWLIIQDQFMSHLRAFVSYLIIGLLALWLTPHLLERWAEKTRTKPLPSAGLGLVTYITGFIGVGLVALLIIAVGASLAYLSLWGLAITWWGLMFSALGMTFFIFILFVAYGSKVIVAYLIGWLILRRLLPRAEHRIWPLLLGLLIYVLLVAIPFLGWVISVIVTLLGLGAVGLVYYDNQNKDVLPT